VLTAALLTGCSGEGEDYCEAVAEEQQKLTELADSESGDVLTPTLDSFERLRDVSPDELGDEWETVVVAYQALVDAVEETGVDPAEYDPEEPPADLSAEEVDRLAAVASKLASARVAAAISGIEEHAKEVCDVDFTG
jgi:hypothetical protein